MATIKTISTSFIFNISVNCYLVSVDDGFVLIDTGKRSGRQKIEAALEAAGVRVGNLKMIVLTHGDFDHCGNAAYFRQKYEANVYMHVDDTGMVERGELFWNRQQPNFLVRSLIGLWFRLRQADRFRPDFYVKDGEDLTVCGYAARVVHLPGHSRGSIGILTPEGDLFCGDLLANTKKPTVWSIMDDSEAATASVAKLKQLAVNKVYPGHGAPFLMRDFVRQGHVVGSRESGETSGLVMR